MLHVLKHHVLQLINNKIDFIVRSKILRVNSYEWINCHAHYKPVLEKSCSCCYLFILIKKIINKSFNVFIYIPYQLGNVNINIK